MYKNEKVLKVIEAIEIERAAGGSFSEIADKFNKDRLRTITGKKWTSVYLFNFYKRNK